VDRWTEFRVFVTIAEERSMTRAAGTLNLSVSGVSRHLVSLETRLGARLVQRSTRQLSLTSEGEQLYADARDLLTTWEEAEASVADRSRAPTGRLRIGASLSFSLLHLMPVVEQFRQAYPTLSVEIVASNRYYDIIENGLDLAIRTRRVEADSSITIRRLAETRRLLAASPGYLSRHAAPEHPRDLTGHDLILYTLADNWNEFRFRRGEETAVVRVDGAIVANDGSAFPGAGVEGLGVDAVARSPGLLVVVANGPDGKSQPVVEVSPVGKSASEVAQLRGILGGQDGFKDRVQTYRQDERRRAILQAELRLQTDG
jgi:DNA-binding transcriptional LysR family regulator